MNAPRTVRMLGTLLLTAALAGCTAGVSPGFANPKAVAPAHEVDDRMTQANEQFSIRLYQTLQAGEPDRNLFLSPVSVSLILSLTANGARGETQHAMLTALAQQSMSMDEVNQANGALQSILVNPDPQVQLTVANSVWYRKGLSLTDTFGQTARSAYRAEAKELDFRSKDAPATINKWVANATNDKIKGVVDQIEPTAVTYLINAIYFNGTWTDKFDESRTQNQDFTLPDGTRKQVPMMHIGGRYRYLQTDKFQAISLPYGGGRVSLYVFLPGPNSSLNEFAKSLTASGWRELMGQFAEQQGTLAMPRVKFEYSKSLNNALKAMGMGPAFGDRADFSGLLTNPEGVGISEVLHKTYLDINERGTEAAAVTSVMATATAAPVGKPFQMVVDRPYFIAIRDDETGAILFLGSVTAP